MSVRTPNPRSGSWFNYILAASLLLVITQVSLRFGAKIRAQAGFNRAAQRLQHIFRPAARPLRNHGAATVPAFAAQHLVAAYEALPLDFEANEGQTDRRVKYLARGPGYDLFLTSREAVLALPIPAVRSWGKRRFAGGQQQAHPFPARRSRLAVVRMRLVGASLHPRTLRSKPLPGVTNYFLGNDPQRWQRHVRHYAWVRYQRVYPGVDLAFHGGQEHLEFDFLVAPGASVAPLRLHFTGAKSMTTNRDGDLILGSAVGDLRLHKPVAYQEHGATRRMVEARFVLRRHRQVTLALGPYDHRRDLVIDPSLSYSTLLGGSAQDDATAIAVDSGGHAFVTGDTQSPNFPGGSGTVSSRGNLDTFVSRFAADGSGLSYTTLLGGSGNETGNSIAVDSNGEAYVAGTTGSANFPVTSGVLGSSLQGTLDAFAAKLDSSGAVAYSTYLGGSDSDSGNAIAVDNNGDAFVGGETFSNNFPGASGSTIQSKNAGFDDGFVAEINPTATAMVYSTYLGGSAADLVTGIALDSSNNAYVTGITLSADFPHTAGAFQNRCGTDGNCNGGLDDAFVTEVKADGSALLYSTYLGGSGTDDANGIAVDGAGEAYVVGLTTSNDLPTVNPAQKANAGAPDAFVTKLKADGSGLIFSTYLGGTGGDEATAIALDSLGDAYVTGRTLSSAGFPVKSAFQAANGGGADAFVTELSTFGTLAYSSYLGGSGNENSFQGSLAQSALGGIAVDSAGNAYLAGNSSSNTDFPAKSPLQTTNAGGVTDAFVAKIGAQAADFSIATAPANVTLTAGSSAEVAVTLTSLNSPFDGAVSLSCTGLPAGASCGFSPSSGMPGAGGFNSTLAISTTSATEAGKYTVRVAGSGGATLHSTTISLTVQDFQLTASALSPATITAKDSATSTVSIAPLNGFASDVTLMCGGSLPAGISCSFNPPEITGGSGTSTLTVSSALSAAAGPATITVVGASGATTHSATVTLTLQAAPDFTISATPLSPAFITSGAAATSTITITPEGGLDGSVALSCSSITPSTAAPPQCSFTPATVANGQGTSTLTVTTVTPVARLAPRVPPRRAHLYAVFLPYAGLALLGAGIGTRRKRVASFLVLLPLVAGLLLLPSCSSGSSGQLSSANPGTPAGNYSIVVTGAVQGSAITHSVSPALTLTVR